MLRAQSLFIVLAFASAAYAATEVSMSDVPEAVRDTATATAPGVTFTRVSTETEGGRTVYEFEGRSPDGKRVEIDVRADGMLEEIEMEMAFDELPAAVKATMESEFPGFKPAYVEASVRGGLYFYEIEGATAAGGAIAVEIAEDGTLTSTGAGAAS